MATKDPNFPAFKWNPETGESQIFNAAHEVPGGWLDQHPSSTSAAEKETAKADATGALPMTKAEIVEALKAGNIPFKAQSGAKALYDLLDTALRAHLAAEKITVPDGANVPALLILANPPLPDANKSE